MNMRTAVGWERSHRDRSLIYVVDDEPMLLQLTAIVLEPCGYIVETFRSPESALGAFKAAHPPPALIIIDYAMQKMTGLELAEACRKVLPTQKILLISGTVSADILHNAPVQPDRFLAKPYQAKQLIDMVDSMLKD